ncbi:MAG: hypothetical protein GEU71_11730 [Actinobacteria bacterium]|nr:hypothetical protein [Actinomycetota bacterium]
MAMTTHDVKLEEVAEAITSATPAFDSLGRRIVGETYRLLARGEAASPADIADAADLPPETTEEILRSWPLTFWDDQDRIFRFWGMAIDRLRPTHSMEMGGRTVYGWCAWDTLFITDLLDTETNVTSTDPHNGETIRLTATGDGVKEAEPSQTIVSFLLPEGAFGADAIEGFCHYVHFFSSSESGGAWVADHPGTFLLTVDEAFRLGRLTNRLRMTPDRGAVPR